MKNLIVLALVLFSVSFAFAFDKSTGELLRDYNNASIQAHAALPASAVCTTTAVTKGTIATVLIPVGTTSIHWEATDSTDSPYYSRRFLNSNTDYMTGSGATEVIRPGTTQFVFKAYSAASRSIKVCTDLNTKP